LGQDALHLRHKISGLLNHLGDLKLVESGQLAVVGVPTPAEELIVEFA